MDKFENFEKSRKENAGKNVAEYAVHKEAFMIAYAILAILMLAFFIVTDDRDNNFNFCFACIALSQSGHSIYKFIRLKRKSDLGIGILYLAISIAEFLLWFSYRKVYYGKQINFKKQSKGNTHSGKPFSTRAC